MQADVSEGKSQLDWYQEKLVDLESQNDEMRAAIGEAERFLKIEKNSTCAEILRLKSTFVLPHYDICA